MNKFIAIQIDRWSKLLEKHEVIYIIFLALLAAIPALSTDMYLAAIPFLAKIWNAGENIVSLSLVLWFASFSIFLLICGPISDRFGRKPVLLVGLGVFIAASFLCATAADVWQLIIYRIFQGASAAAPSSMCMAICRDRYEGEKRKRALAYIGIILAVAPMIAPTIGGILLKFSSWRFIFLTQGVLVLITWLLSFGYQETAGEKIKGGIFNMFSRYITLFQNTSYMLANTTMGLLAGPFFGFIAFSSIVYIQIYHLSSMSFGLLFGLNGLMSMLGAFSCTRLMKKYSDIQLLTTSIIGCILAALGLIAFGGVNYFAFAGFISLFTFCCSLSRPLSNHLILWQVNHDIGTASSFIVFYQFIVGATCMWIATAGWKNPIFAFSILAFIFPLVVLIIWPFLLKITGNNKPQLLG
ncbi:MAG: multidrug effflux MFS transporter [Phycisphaerae bacterium]|jgi:DHA1 family bicyclomycin/chloramphenicol resistance-like MFS transporter